MNPCTKAAVLAVALGAASTSAQTTTTETRPTLELALDQVVEMALKNNSDIAVERYRPEISAADVLAAQGAYDPELLADVRRASSTSPARNVFAGGAKVSTEVWDYDFGAGKLFGSGATARVDFVNGRSDTDDNISTFNPSYNSTLTASLSQPLLRNFKIDASRQRLRVAKLNREISDVQFHATVVNIVAQAKRQYHDVTAAQDNLEAQRKSLTLARKLLDENQIKVRVGTLAPLDVVSAEAEVASREEVVIRAEATLEQTQDNLKRTIIPKNDPSMWATRFVTKDRPTALPPQVDIEAAIRTALDKRTDIRAARKGIESANVNLDYARNQLKPMLDLRASYGATGIGGTQQRDATGEALAVPIEGGYGDSVSDVFGRDFPTWSVGVQFTYPLFNRSARGLEARNRLTKEQAEASLQRLELQIAADVRTAGRNLETGYKRVEATRAARVLSQRRLEAESKRFDAGMSTNFLVTQAQRDLAVAEVNEIVAVLDYNKAQIDFERVQEAAGNVVFTSGTSASSATGF